MKIIDYIENQRKELKIGLEQYHKPKLINPSYSRAGHHQWSTVAPILIKEYDKLLEILKTEEV